MAIIEKNGFKFFDGIKKKSMIIESEKLDQCLSYCIEHDIENISINRFHGYKFSNINFLEKVSFFKSVSISANEIDLSALHYLKQLKSLTISEKIKQTIDFSSFPEINEISAIWSKKIQNPRGLSFG